MNDPISRLFGFCRDLSAETLPAPVREQAKLVLLDTLGVILSGSRAAEVDRMFSRLAAGAGGHETVTCPGRAARLPILPAVLVNGMAGSNQEWEEGNSRAMGHPAIQLVPALLAESERAGLPGAKLIPAFVAAYEAACRISRASAIRRGLHPTGTWGVVGSAAGVGLLRGRRAEELAAVADIAASYAFSPYVKNSFAGRSVACTFAAMVNFIGVLANDFFDAGIRADAASLEMTFSRFVSESFDPAVLSEGLGDSYAVAENYIKPYPACRFAHPALEALGALLGEHAPAPPAVERIRVWSFKAAVHGGGEPPGNLEAMRFSIPFLTAVRLVHGAGGLERLTDAQREDPQVIALSRRVELILEPEYEALRPLRSPARVEIVLKDGRRLTQEILDCLGDPANPMPRERVSAKFLRLAAPVVGEGRAQEFSARIQDLENEPDMRRLTALLRPAEGTEET